MGIFENLQSFYFTGAKEKEEEKKKDTPIRIEPKPVEQPTQVEKPETKTFTLPETKTTTPQSAEYFNKEKKKEIAYDYLKSITVSKYDTGIIKTLQDAGAVVKDPEGKFDQEKSLQKYKDIKAGKAKPQVGGLEKATKEEPEVIKPVIDVTSSIKKLDEGTPYITTLGKEVLSNYTASKKLYSEQPKATNEKFLSQSPLQKIITSGTVASDIESGLIEFVKDLTGIDKEGQKNLITGLKSSFEATKSAGSVIASRIANRLSEVEGTTAGEKGQEDLKKVSKYLENKSKEYINKANLLASDLPVIDGDTFLEKLKDKNFISQGIAMNTPQMLAALGISAPFAIAGAPAAVTYGTGFLTAGTLEGGFAYEEAINSGATPETADKVAVFNFIGNGILEMLPVGKLLNRLKNGPAVKEKILKNFTRKVISAIANAGEQVVSEGGTEGLQQMLTNSVAQVYYDEQRGLLDGVTESLFFGGIMGAGSSIGIDILNNVELKGLSIEDISELNKKVNEENSASFKRDVTLGLREEDRATGKTLDNLKFNGVFPEGTTENSYVNVYSATKNGQINTGDFVTTDPVRAEKIYKNQRPGSEVQSLKVRVGDLINSMGVNGEFVYAPDDYVKLTSRIEQLSDEERAIYDTIIGEEIATKLQNNKGLTLDEEILAGDLLVDFKSDTLEDLDDIARKEFGKELNRKQKELGRLQKDITKAVGEELKRRKIEYKSLQDDIEKTIERSKFLTPEEGKKVFDLVVKKQQEGTLTPNVVTRKESVLLRDKLREAEKVANKAKRITTKQIREYQSAAKKIVDEYKSGDIKNNLRKWLQTAINNLAKNNVTEVDFKNTIRNIEERLTSEINKESNLKYSKKIAKLLNDNRTKRRAGSKPQTKGYPYEVQLAIDTLYTANKIWEKYKAPDLVSKKIDEKMLRNELDIEIDGDLNGTKKFENYYYQQFKDSKNRRDTLRLVESIINDGSVIKNLINLNAEAEFNAQKEFFVQKIYGDGKEKPTATQIAQRSRIKNMYESTMKRASDYIFSNYNVKLLELNTNNSVTTDKYNPFEKLSFFREEQNRLAMLDEFRTDTRKAMIDIYGSGKRFSNETLTLAKVFKYLKKDIKLTDDVTLTKGEIIKDWMNLQHDVENGNREILLNSKQYNDATIKAIEENMTDKDKAFAQFQWDMYQKYGAIEREDYQKFKGADIGYLGDKYSPIKIENFEVEHEDSFNITAKDRMMRGMMYPSSVITRGKGGNKIIKTEDSLSALQDYVEQIARDHAYREQANFVDKIIRDKDIKTAIKFTRGKEFYNGILRDIDRIKGRGKLDSVALIDKIRSNIIIATLAFKLVQIPKQYTSIVAYADELSPTELAFGMDDYYKNRKANRAKMEKLNSFFRLRGKNMDEAFSAALNPRLGEVGPISSAVKSASMKTTFIGDKAPILAGGWAMYLKKLKEYKAKEPNRNQTELEIKALEYAAKFSDATQQSQNQANLGEAQTSNSFSKLAFTYAQSNIGFQRKINHAVKSLFRKDGLKMSNLKKVAKTIFIFHVLTNIAFQAAADIGDEDIRKLIRASVIGNFNKFLFGWDAIGSAWDMKTNGYTYGDEGIIQSKLNIINNLVSTLDDDDITETDWKEFFKDSSEELGALAGYPVKQAYQFYDGFNRVADGDTERGLRLLSGQTSWQVDENNELNRLKNRSTREEIPEEESVKIIQKFLDKNEITREYASEVYQSISKDQLKVIGKKRYKVLNDLKTTEARDRYFNGLTESEQKAVVRQSDSLFNSEVNRLKDRQNVKLISAEEALEQFNKWRKDRWVPPQYRKEQ